MKEGSPDQNGRDPRVEILLSLDPPASSVSKGQQWQYSVLFSPEAGGPVAGQSNADGSLTITVGLDEYTLAYDGASSLRVEKTGSP
jgi:hypothetical protein